MYSPTIDKEQVRRIGQFLDLLRSDVAQFPVFPLGENNGPFNDTHWETVGRLVNALKGSDPEEEMVPTLASGDQPVTDGSAPEVQPGDVKTAPADTGSCDAVATAPDTPSAPPAPARRPIAPTDLQSMPANDASTLEAPASASAAAVPAPSPETTMPNPTEPQAGESQDQPVQSTTAPVESTVSPQGDQAPATQAQTAAASPAQAPAQPQTPPPAPKPQVVVKKETLPNAMVGRQFSAELKLSDSDILAIRDIDAPQLADLGLGFDPDTRTLSGVPTKDGDHKIALTATVDGPTPGKTHTVQWTGMLTVNPDPKSLWRDEPSNQSDPDWKDDEVSEHVPTEKHVMFAASKRGRSHAHNGLFRDDDVAIGHDPQFGWNVLVVADGAGSAPKSRKGSQLAVMTARQELLSALPAKFGLTIHDLVSNFRKGDPKAESDLRRDLYSVLATAAYRAYAEIFKHANGKQEPVKAFSTTLIMAIQIETPAGHLVAGFGIGDGGAALLDLEGGKVYTLTKADGGEFAGQTRFLSHEEFADTEDAKARLAQRLQFCAVDSFTALVAMTDGVTDPMFPTDAVFQDFDTWRKFWTENLDREVGISTRAEDAEDRLLKWLDFWSPGDHDDRTIAILV